MRALRLFWIACWLAAWPAAAVDSAWFARLWQSDDGLPDNNVTGIAQTSDGYLWVATQGGLAKFDGLQFKRYSLPIVSGSSMEMIRALTVGEGDHLWLALEGGVVMCIAPGGTKVYTATNGLWVFRPSSIVEDAERAVWVGYWDGSACRIAGDEVKHFSEKDGLPATGLCSLTTDSRKQLWFTQGGRVGVYRDGRFVGLTAMRDYPITIAARRAGGVWICSGKGLFQFQEGGQPEKVADLAAPVESFESLALFEDHAGAVWTGTAATGLFRCAGTNVARIETSRGEIRCVTEDREGNIWAGTSGGGLNRLNPRAVQLFGSEQGLPFETVRSACEDGAGSLWVVTQNGFLARSRGSAWSLVGDWPRAQASCIASDPEGNVWIGTTGSGLFCWSNGVYSVLHPRDGLISDRIWTVMADRDTNIWAASDRPNSVQRLHHGQYEKFELPAGSHVVRAMCQDQAHDVWFGAEDGRLLKISAGVLTDETSRTLPKQTPIRCLYADADGSVWIGYGGAGVGRLRGDHFARVGLEQGLPDDFISQIAADERGALWCAGNRGIFSVQQSEMRAAADGKLDKVRATLYGKNEGAPSLQANFGFGLAAVRTRDDRICFSMLTGLAVVHPGRIRFNDIPPPVLIERVSLDGRPLAPRGAGPLDLPQRQRDLKIDFNALSFTAPENVRLRYQLEGYDPKPIETAQRSVTYSRLPIGRYRFHVTACNNSGVWNTAGAALNFVVEPLFWQTWWFRAAVIAACAGLTIAVVRYISFRRLREKLLRLEQESAVQKDRARIAKDLHDDLGAHLSHIAMLSELAQTDFEKPPQARGHLDQIFQTARLLTRSLDEIVWAVNPRNDTLDRFVAHVCQFAPEFLRAAGLRSRLDMPMELPPVELAASVRHQLYLGLKEALHNIVKHARATEVWLRLAVRDGAVIVVIEDDGRGFDAAAAPEPGEDGLINLRHRMEEIGGHFEKQSKPAQGTRLIFTAPIDGKAV
ncbi:MAG TPA: two-component regulator propeller domain-containing protein [Verrucomicrobiae bacterium]|nr:two-component regulator propeller domain-containing protein [Verrucomicrobiae bacterium]